MVMVAKQEKETHTKRVPAGWTVAAMSELVDVARRALRLTFPEAAWRCRPAYSPKRMVAAKI